MGGIVKAITGGLFGGEMPKAPELPPLPPSPTSAENLAAQNAVVEEERRKRAGSGRASTDLTGGGIEDTEEIISAKKVLLG